MKTPAKIGIVSGVGPLAGADVLAKVLENAAEVYGAVEDSDYPDIVLISHGVPGVDNTGSLSIAFEQQIIAMVHDLESQGCNIIGIACNTAHLFLPKIITTPETIVINLIDVVAMAAKTSDCSFLLLTSATSKEQKLYHSYLSKHHVSFSETSIEQQKHLDDAIGHVMAHKLPEAGESIRYALELSDHYDGIIAGCTELPLALSACNTSGFTEIIDSNNELALALLKYYYHYEAVRVVGSMSVKRAKKEGE